MATAISKLWPDAQFAYGPPIDQGFYYDVDLEHRITPDDFPAIEAEMKKVVKENQTFEKMLVSRDEALKLARSGRLTFKIDLLEKIPEGEEISIFKNGDFWDLCAGPHVGRTGNCKAHKLMSVAAAFYEGDASKPQLQRVYGTAFKNKTLLTEHLERLEEAKERDHRKLGKELDLFHIDEAVGQGLILWKPNGATVRQELQNFISEHLVRQGYSQVFTPHIGKLDLYRTSGHFPYYADSQFPPSDGELEGFMLKPMNCPHHIKIFASNHHSYRDLPVRLAEFGTVYRWEQSGELGGMTRVRGFTQDDAHLFCTEDQVKDEIMGCLELVKIVLGTLGMNDYRVRIGLRDPDDSKYVGDAENWDRAEEALREAAKSLGTDFTEEPGEAAFYGPKIDFVVKDVLDREWQLGTVQVDYNLPKRFDLSYVGSDNESHTPVMIHRAPFGSMERFIGVLIEHFAGKFPTWLAPEQVRIIPVSEKYFEFSEKVEAVLKEAGVRVKLDRQSEKVGAKIRLAQIDKIPYMLVIGEREQDQNQVSIRHRDRGDEGSVSVDEFRDKVTEEMRSRSL
ncbi:UNVERIFIED_CONTAM: hypothetical protein GTU68_046110 [Idotea baltica]|nr:hypothetical protein [Idotea baltica]